MGGPGEKLAASLARLEELRREGRRVFRSRELSRTHRERLVRNGFLLPVLKGWLAAAAPGAAPDDATPWRAACWEFCAAYCSARFGQDWHLSPEQSLLLHAEDTVVPQRIVIHAPKGANNATALPFGASLYDLRRPSMPPPADRTARDGLNLLTPAAALVRAPEAFFTRHPAHARTVLSGIRDVADVLGRLLDGGRSVVAGRLAGAFRQAGRPAAADEILKVMKDLGYDVRQSDPFASARTPRPPTPAASPPAVLLRSLWEDCRGPAIAAFPAPSGPPRNPGAYLSSVDAAYQRDAYHSLSIEGYRVTPELIRRARAAGRGPGSHDEDRKDRDAFAARGYWQAFRRVRRAVEMVMAGAGPGALFRAEHQDWRRALFQPGIDAGLYTAADLAGYRNIPAYLRGSRHVPPRREAVPDAMQALFGLLEDEEEPSARAVLGHWMLGYIHPWVDGNGRMARLVMNLMLASGGYPWTVIRVEDRAGYLAALESASVDRDIGPFARFVAARVRKPPTRRT